MARLFLTNIDLKGNQLVNVVLHNVSGSGGLSTSPGAMYYDSGTNKFQFRLAGGWIGYLPDTTTLATIGAPAAQVDLNNQKIVNLTDPSNPQDAANKRYVDAAVQGIDWKASVRVATTTELASTFTSPGATTVTYANNTPGTTASTITVNASGGNWTGVVVDGNVTLAVGNRILIKNQGTGLQNGIYTVTQVGTTANTTPFIFTRAADADVDGELSGGSAVWVEEGGQADTGWVITTNGSIIIGTTASAWTQFSGAGQITAGDGLTKNGNTIDIAGATLSGLTIAPDSIAVDATKLWIGTSNVVLASSAPTSQALTGITSITGHLANFTLNPATRGSGNGYSTTISGGSTSASGVGGVLYLYGGNGVGGNGGQVNIDGGTGTAVGALNIGTASSTINIGQASVSTTTIAGTTKLSALANGFVKTINSTGELTVDTTVLTTASKISAHASTTSAELAGVISDETGFNSTGILVFNERPTLNLPSINNVRFGYTTTATSGTTQVIDNVANFRRYYTGSTAQTVTLPDVTTLVLGHSYEFHNNSTAILTVQSSGGQTVVAIPSLMTVLVTCIAITGTTNSSWDFDFTGGNAQPIRKVAGTIALTAATAAAITHNLNTRDVNVQMWETSSSLPTQVVEMDVTNTSTSQVTVTSSLTGTYYYVIMG
jgi:hypothetical protein